MVDPMTAWKAYLTYKALQLARDEAQAEVDTARLDLSRMLGDASMISTPNGGTLHKYLRDIAECTHKAHTRLTITYVPPSEQD